MHHLQRARVNSFMMTELRELVCQLYDVGAVKFGSFKLKSGVLSPVYFDLRVMVSYPKLMVSVQEKVKGDTWVNPNLGVHYFSDFSLHCSV